MNKKVILIIRDGWGYNPKQEGNYIAQANTPFTNELMKTYPNTLVKAAGMAVGLPDGYQGNSEVGHMTIGSGRINFQSFPKINLAIENGSFFKIPEFLNAINNCKKNNSSLHIIGLLQTEAVHAHQNHMYALLELCKKENFNNVFIHAFTDGRDAPVNLGIGKIQLLKDRLSELGFGKIATVAGRYYGMDRDKRWDRTKKAYDCIVNASADMAQDPVAEIQTRYDKNETDEFIVPFKIGDYEGVKENDSIIFFNFRTERTRQLTQAIVEDEFSGWERKLLNVVFVCMTQYYSPIKADVAFKDEVLKNLLGQVVADNKLQQYRISETEKYAHVTFFFNGQTETPYDGEDRLMISSPKVDKYDQTPEMSVSEITEKLTKAIESKKYDFIVTNFVNCDIVGHTANREAIIKAVESVDKGVEQTVKSGLANDYDLLVFADHGNAEDKIGEFATSHTTHLVPCIYISKDNKSKLRSNGGLSDIAPTVLDILGLEKPIEMTGSSLLKE